MTNDPKQRPMFASFDGVFNTILFTVLAIVLPTLPTSMLMLATIPLPSSSMNLDDDRHYVRHLYRDRRHLHCTQRPPGILWHWQTHQGRPERLLGYPENNRAIQMLVLSASTDKLGSTAKTSAVSVAMFACIAGSIKLQGSVTAVTTIPSVILTFLVISIVATCFAEKP